MAHFLDKFFGDANQKTVNRLQVVVDKINTLEPDLEKLSDAELKERSKQLRQKIREELGYLKNGEFELPALNDEIAAKEQRALDAAAPEAFALVRETAKRVLGERHFDVQLMAGLALHEGNIAEQKTGEGKTLSATLPTYLNALIGRGTHVITVNDYLAKRDAGWMGQVYDFLGLTVGCLAHESSFQFSVKTGEDSTEAEEYTEGEAPVNLTPITRHAAYRLDITYGTNSEFGFDYLRDNMAPASQFLRQRPLNYCLIDEVDSILIDEARTPLIISAPAEESGDLYAQFAQLAPRLTEEDYLIEEKENAVRLTDEGMQKVQQWLKVESLYEDENILLVHHLEEALKAEFLFKRDKDYVVRDGEIIIVDEFTGRLMPGRRYSEGLHQAIEAKEGVHVQRESDTLATISIQNYFRLYRKLSGMTGTAKTEEEEFIKTYQMDVVVIPTNRPMIRVDQSDKVYINEEAKFKAIIEDVKEKQQNGQPVLVGTISVAKNELFSKLLTKAGVPHEILNAKNHEKEAAIIAQAGRPGSVTLATNMAGRGTNIVLGGTPPEKNDSQQYVEWEKLRAAAIEAGGLCVIGTERHESRRIDNQLRGRAGRQGEPGESIFYVSLDDDLMRIFGGERLKGWMQKANLPDNLPIQNSIVSKSIEQAQKRVEGHNFDIRRHVLQYDDVMNKHRETLYKRRRQVMEAGGPDGQNGEDPTMQELGEVVKNIIKSQGEKIAKQYATGDQENWDLEQLVKEVSAIAPLSTDDAGKLKDALVSCHESKQVAEIVSDGLLRRYEEKEQTHGAVEQRQLERSVLLRTIDALWVEHLNIMSDLRQGVGLQAVAQKDPLVVYQQEGYERFKYLMNAIDNETTRQLMHLTKVVQPAPEVVEQKRTLVMQGASESAISNNTDTSVTVRKVSNRLSAEGSRNVHTGANTKDQKGNKVGRNDPCWCGSGKKYKKCHGKQ